MEIRTEENNKKTITYLLWYTQTNNNNKNENHNHQKKYESR